MVSVKMYSRRFCPYCVRAKRLLEDLDVTFEEIAVDHDDSAFQEMQRLSGRRTVPQIWVADLHVGGCDELVALHRAGQLVHLLRGS